ncbi:hypothetical protein BH23PLA1_BH23PLA1_19430 [soil metagenome]
MNAWRPNDSKEPLDRRASRKSNSQVGWWSWMRIRIQGDGCGLQYPPFFLQRAPRLAVRRNSSKAASMLVLLLLLGLSSTIGDPNPLGSIVESPQVPALPPGAEVATFRIDALGLTTTVYSLPPGPRTIQRVEWSATPDSSDWSASRFRLIRDAEDRRSPALDFSLGRDFDLDDPTLSLDKTAIELLNDQPFSYRRGGRLILDTTGEVRGTFRIVSTPGLPSPGEPQTRSGRSPIQDSRAGRGAQGNPASSRSSGFRPRPDSETPSGSGQTWPDP